MRKMRNKQVSFILALLTIMVTVVSAIMPAKAYAEEGKYTLTLKMMERLNIPLKFTKFLKVFYQTILFQILNGEKALNLIQKMS